MTKREIDAELEVNGHQLVATLDLWIDHVDLGQPASKISDSIRALCLERARALYVQRTLLRRELQLCGARERAAHAA